MALRDAVHAIADYQQVVQMWASEVGGTYASARRRARHTRLDFWTDLIVDHPSVPELEEATLAAALVDFQGDVAGAVDTGMLPVSWALECLHNPTTAICGGYSSQQLYKMVLPSASMACVENNTFIDKFKCYEWSQPTPAPTPAPTGAPTDRPTDARSAASPAPSPVPSARPSAAPRRRRSPRRRARRRSRRARSRVGTPSAPPSTLGPSPVPSYPPSRAPTGTPSYAPSASPSQGPSSAPARADGRADDALRADGRADEQADRGPVHGRDGQLEPRVPRVLGVADGGCAAWGAREYEAVATALADATHWISDYRQVVGVLCHPLSCAVPAGAASDRRRPRRARAAARGAGGARRRRRRPRPTRRAAPASSRSTSRPRCSSTAT